MGVKYVKPNKMNHPMQLSDMDFKRIEAVLNGKLSNKWVSAEELEAYGDELYDVLAAQAQTHEGSLVLQ
jgi:hypothetical protein